MAGVVLATAGYDHTIRFWEAASGTCNRTVKYPDSVALSWSCSAISQLFDIVRSLAALTVTCNHCLSLCLYVCLSIYLSFYGLLI